jgi:hypothetical protein
LFSLGAFEPVRLPALEKNILIYRALQMALFLFYSEDLRRQLIASVAPVVRDSQPPLKGGKLLKRIFRELESRTILTPAESAEMQSLLEHRDTIAHNIQLLTGDIHIPGRRYRDIATYLRLKYDYRALARIKHWNKMIWAKLRPHFTLTISWDPLLFEAAEHAYEKELASLRRRIDRQYELRKREAARRT